MTWNFSQMPSCGGAAALGVYSRLNEKKKTIHWPMVEAKVCAATDYRCYSMHFYTCGVYHVIVPRDSKAIEKGGLATSFHLFLPNRHLSRTRRPSACVRNITPFHADSASCGLPPLPNQNAEEELRCIACFWPRPRLVRFLVQRNDPSFPCFCSSVGRAGKRTR